MSSRIPLQPLIPVLQEWCDGYATHAIRADENEGSCFGQISPQNALSPAAVLAMLANDVKGGPEIKRDTITKMLNGYAETVRFDVADKLICAINPMLWHTNRSLREVYRGVDFSDEIPAVAA